MQSVPGSNPVRSATGRWSIAAIAAALCLAAGCAPVQQWLEPHVCECQQAAPAQSQPDPAPEQVARVIATHQIDEAYHRADAEGILAARQREIAAEQQAAAEPVPYRDPEELATEPINPVVSDSEVSLDDEEQRGAFEDRYGIELSDDTRVYRGAFAGSDRSVVAIHRPGDRLELRDESELLATLPLDEYTSEIPPGDLIPFSPGGIELVQDGSDQLQLLHTETDDDTDRVVYHVGIYKLIGSYVGTIFEKPIAVVENDQSPRSLAQLRFLHGIDHRIIEWTPLDENEEPTGESVQFEWNRWEGVYRIPHTPPTAPEQFDARLRLSP